MGIKNAFVNSYTVFRRELASNSEVLLTWWKIFKGYAHMRIISPAGIV